MEFVLLIIIVIIYIHSEENISVYVSFFLTATYGNWANKKNVIDGTIFDVYGYLVWELMTAAISERVYYSNLWCVIYKSYVNYEFSTLLVLYYDYIVFIYSSILVVDL